MNKDKGKLSLQDELAEFLLYTTPDGGVKVEVFLYGETVWLPQKRIAELFGVGVPAISKHLDNIYASGELEKPATVSILETVQLEGKRQVARSDTTIGKNYLSETEIKQLERTVSAFFDYIENIVERRNSFTMKSFTASVNKFLEFNEYKILEGHGSISRMQAEEKAFGEYERFNKTQLIDSDFDRMVKELSTEGNHE